LADRFTREIIAQSDFGIDLHSAGLHRENLPQIRISEGRPYAEVMAQIFGAPAVIVSKLREGSLRQTAADLGCDVLLLEAGEALRFDEYGIRVGVSGILRVMSQMAMGIAEPHLKAAFFGLQSRLGPLPLTRRSSAICPIHSVSAISKCGPPSEA
jgi:hypothetical protein